MNELVSRLGPFWTLEKVSAELSLTPVEVERAVSDADVLGLRTEDGLAVFPVSQFLRIAGQVRVRAGVQAMLSELREEDAWSVGLLFATPAPELNNVSPYDAEKDGATPEELAEFARIVRREWRDGSRSDLPRN